MPLHRPTPRRAAATAALAAVLGLAACSAPSTADPPVQVADPADWDAVVAQAQGQTVDLWMYGGDVRGNSYVDDVLAPAAAELGVTLRRVPVTDTQDALNRVLSEQQAGRDDGAVDLVWVNGENFRSGRQAEAWLCGWADDLPSARFLDQADPLLAEDFGTPVDGCEAPWHKAQLVVAYDSDDVPDPPTSVSGLLDWAEQNPGRFTYPAPPDFTGSAFLRQALYGVSGGADAVPTAYPDGGAPELTDALWERLAQVAPALWRQGETYPRDLAQLEDLFRDDQVSFTMTYGPATLDQLVRDGTFPAGTRVLPLDGGTLGNASFLAIPRNAGDAAGAMVVADLALSPDQQLAKADPGVWGQYTVLDPALLPAEQAAGFAELPASTVVPPFEELSRGALPELSADWVAPLEAGWREQVLGR